MNWPEVVLNVCHYEHDHHMNWPEVVINVCDYEQLTTI